MKLKKGAFPIGAPLKNQGIKTRYKKNETDDDRTMFSLYLESNQYKATLEVYVHRWYVMEEEDLQDYYREQAEAYMGPPDIFGLYEIDFIGPEYHPVNTEKYGEGFWLSLEEIGPDMILTFKNETI